MVRRPTGFGRSGTTILRSRMPSACCLHAGAGVQHAGAVCRQFCTNRNATASSGRVWFCTCSCFLSLVAFSSCHWSLWCHLTCPTQLPLVVFVVLLEVFSAKVVVWFERRGADWDSAVLDPATLSHVPQGLPTPGPDRFNATTAHDPHISDTFGPPVDRLYRPQDAWFDPGRPP